MSRPPVIAIAGAGFSGSLLAVQLAAKARAPLHIQLYDAAHAFARGVAYGTRDPSHLLNVRADRMGAFEDRPDDFHCWLLAHEAQWRAQYPALSSLEITPGGFMPRMLYGDYIASLLEQARHNANGVTIDTIPAQMTDAEMTADGITITLADGSKKKAARLALALGNLLAGEYGFEKEISGNPRYTGNLWAPPQGGILTCNHFSDRDSPVLIIGTGLTMVDMLLSLRARSYGGKVIAVSRHGLLPQPHTESVAPYARYLAPQSAPRTALGLLSAIRHETRRARASGQDWCGVVDALRADTPALWTGLPEPERNRLTRVLAFWSTHRHRMPPSSAAFIEGEIDGGTLEIRRGRIENISEADSRLLVRARLKDGSAETLAAAHVLNCAGPSMDIGKSGNPLLLQLLARGIVRKGPLGWGLAAEEDGRVRGSAPGSVFALGPLLAGEQLETIAVPELRKQAEQVAAAMLASLAG